MSAIAGFSGVGHYRDLSWFQVFRLKSFNNKLIANLNITDGAKVEELHDWQEIAYRVNNTINAAKPFYRVILDFLTLQFIKRWVLLEILPGVITKIDAAVATAPISDHTLATALRAHKYFLDNKAALCGELPGRREVENEIEEYFKEKIDLLLAKQVVALPLFYHATEDRNLIGIINNGHLKPGPGAVYGTGVYFSTEDESRLYYGPYTFAVDFSVIRTAQAAYTQVTSGLDSALWVCIKKNVPITWDSVAHIVVDNKIDKDTMLAKLTNIDGTGIDDTALGIVTCPVLTRQASNVIRRTFQNTYIYKLPPWWKKPWYGTAPTKARLPYVQV